MEKKKWQRYEKHSHGSERVPIPVLPWLPLADQKPTKLLEATIATTDFPPLMKQKSWTKAKPYKDAFAYLKPKDTIGSCYTPTANMLRLEDMPPLRRRVEMPTGVFNTKGEFQYPPIPPGFRYMEDPRMIRKKRALERNQPGVVNLLELLTGEHDRKKQKLKEKKESKKRIKLKQGVEQLNKKLEEERKQLALMQADLPIDPDTQKQQILETVEAEQKLNNLITEEDINRIRYYTFIDISESMIQPYHEPWFQKALECVSPKVKKKFTNLLKKTKDEIEENYYVSMRITILDYLMLDKLERKRIKMSNYPIPYPSIIIRSPVPWHQEVIMCSQRIRHNLFTHHPVLVALRDYWFKKYRMKIILPLENLINAGLPLEPPKFNDLVQLYCSQFKANIIEEWLVDVADIIYNMKDTWLDHVPKSSDDSTRLIEKFFHAINTLLSLQIREIITNSLNHFLDILLQYEIMPSSYMRLSFLQSNVTPDEDICQHINRASKLFYL